MKAICRILILLGAIVGPAKGENREEIKQFWYVPGNHQLAFDLHDDRHLAASEDTCKIVEECHLCDAAARSDITACTKTGRIERWQCEPIEEEEEGG